MAADDILQTHIVRFSTRDSPAKFYAYLLMSRFGEKCVQNNAVAKLRKLNTSLIKTS